MTSSVLLFGRLKDIAGAASVPFPPGVATAADLRSRLAADHPHLAAALGGKSVRMAVNQSLVTDEAGQPISASDEIALLPPLSGG